MILETSEFSRGKKGESERRERVRELSVLCMIYTRKKGKNVHRGIGVRVRGRWRMDVDDDGKLNGASKHTHTGKIHHHCLLFLLRVEESKGWKRGGIKEERGREHKKKKVRGRGHEKKKVMCRTGEKERAETVKVTLFFLNLFSLHLKNVVDLKQKRNSFV